MLSLVALLTLPVAAPIPEGRPEGLVVWSAPLAPAMGENAKLGATAGVWTPDGRHVLTAGASAADGPWVGEVRVWDAATGRHVRSFRGTASSYSNRAGHLAVSPDGKSVAAGGVLRGPDGIPRAHFVEVWDWQATQPRAKLGGFDHYVSGVTFSPDGRRLLAAGLCGSVNGWDAATGRPVVRAGVTSRWAFGLSHHPRHPILAGADLDGAVRVLDAATGKAIATLLKQRTPDGFMSAAFAPDGRALACAEGGGSDAAALVVIPVQVGDNGAVSAGPPVSSPDRVDGCVYQVAYSPDGRLIAAACQDRTVRLYDADTARLLAIAREHADFVYSVAFSPDGRRLLSVGRDAVKVWSVAELRNRRPAP